MMKMKVPVDEKKMMMMMMMMMKAHKERMKMNERGSGMMTMKNLNTTRRLQRRLQ